MLIDRHRSFVGSFRVRNVVEIRHFSFDLSISVHVLRLVGYVITIVVIEDICYTIMPSWSCGPWLAGLTTIRVG